MLTLLLTDPVKRMHWEKYAAASTYIWRCTPGATGYTPFKLMYGVDPPMPIDQLMQQDKLTEQQQTELSSYKEDMQDVYEKVRQIQRRASILQIIAKDKGQTCVHYQQGDLVRVFKSSTPKKYMDDHFTYARVVKHNPGNNYMKVTILRYGKWVTDRVHLRNVLPATRYTEKCWTTPDTNNISEQPPTVDDSTSVVGVPLTVDDSTSVVGRQSTSLKPGMYAVIPATCWADIVRDGYEFGYGKCLRIYTKNDVSYAVLHRYGNYSAKFQKSTQIHPGWLDPRDKRYVFCKKPPTTRYQQLVNVVQETETKDHPIRVQDLTIVFDNLTKKGHVPPEVVDRIRHKYPMAYPGPVPSYPSA